MRSYSSKVKRKVPAFLRTRLHVKPTRSSYKAASGLHTPVTPRSRSTGTLYALWRELGFAEVLITRLQNAIGRFIAFPVADLQASADLNINITKLANATADFDGADSLSGVTARWSTNGTATNSNPGQLQGNKMFFASDVMVRMAGSVCSIEAHSLLLRSIAARTTSRQAKSSPVDLGIPSAPTRPILMDTTC